MLASTETTRLIRDGEKGKGGMEVGGEGDYIPIATLSPSLGMTRSCVNLRCINCEGHSPKTVSTDTFEEKGEAEADSNRGPSAYQHNALLSA